MFKDYNFTAAERLMRYAQIDTQSDSESETHPTTEKQKDLARLLAKELQEMGLADAETDEFGYVYATVPANSDKQTDVICFCSHIDTATDCSGTNVKPILHKNYDGREIVLPDNPSLKLTVEEFPYLKQHIGGDIITASGNTLLGADDKAGVSIIMDTANYLVSHPEIKHGAIRLLFTPDEEVGKGTAKVDMKKLGARYGYTLDGGEAGCMENETFSADAVRVIIHGVITHPGNAKGMMVNALKLAAEILENLPKDHLSPETTEKLEGFIHPVSVNGLAEKCTVDFIIRDFITAGLATKEQLLEEIVKKVLDKYPTASYEFKITEQYRNMKEVLDGCPHVIDYARAAIERAGLKVTMESIRGGTDGSRLSFMGMPCPNIFTGMQNIHGKREWIGVNDMNKAVETLVHLAMIWEEKAGS